jgi:hypothetical protein
MLLKAMGVDPAQVKQNIEEFMAMMRTGVEKIDAAQQRIESKLDAILANQELARGTGADRPPSTQHILENGANTGVLITGEKFPKEMLADAGMVE